MDKIIHLNYFEQTFIKRLKIKNFFEIFAFFVVVKKRQWIKFFTFEDKIKNFMKIDSDKTFRTEF